MVTAEFLMFAGYFEPRQLPDGRWIGLRGMNFTIGLFVGLDEFGYSYRYCYEELADAVLAGREWDGKGDAPGNWIKRKGGGQDLTNPNYKGTEEVA